MPKFKATRPIKYRGVIRAVDETFDVPEGDAHVIQRAFGAVPVTEPVRRATRTVVAEPAPAPVDVLDPGHGAESPVRRQSYATRRLKAED